MQQIQKFVLNNIYPEQKPVFIVSPNISDGDHLAHLLSNHIILKGIYKISENKLANKNFFFSEEVRKLSLKNLDESIKKNEEYKTTLKFIFDKAFDNGKLWGLQIDYKLFFELDAAKIFPDAFFIFLYGTKIKRPSKKNDDEIYLRKIYDFNCNNELSSTLINVYNVLHIPEIILQSFTYPSGVLLKLTFDINELFNGWKVGIPYPFSGDDGREIKSSLNKRNLLFNNSNWYQGDEFLFLIVPDDDVSSDALLKRINQFSSSFIFQPDISIICKNDFEKRIAERSLSYLSSSDTLNISTITCYTNVADTLNKIIRKSEKTHIVIDDLSMQFSITNLLSPFKNIKRSPEFSYSNVSTIKIEDVVSTKISLVDALSFIYVPNNLAFTKENWNALKGFDDVLNYKIALWDFIIRSLDQPDVYGLEVDGIINENSSTYDNIEKRMVPFEGYKPILNKHHKLFEDKLLQVVKLFSENQYIPLHEVKKLNHKVGSLQSLLVHSKDEVRSLSSLGSELQHRINIMEGRWHFRLANKIDKFRKIFFKKKSPGSSNIKKILKFILFTVTKPGFRIIRKIFKNALRRLYLLVEDRKVEIVYLDNTHGNGIHTYNDWVNKKLDHLTLKNDYDKEYSLLKNKPKISIVMPVYDPPANYLKYAIESVQNQLYTNWELCIADDMSPNPQIKKILEGYALKDRRIKVVFREENGHISESSNSALAIATGDYILFMDHDDLLTTNCCFEVVKYINEHPEKSDIIYSDEDKVDGNTYLIPHFKPEWAPDNLLSRNYFGHVVVMKKTIVDDVKGFRLGFEGSQDYDIILRATERTNKIGHIPKILYHWRIHDKSAAQGEDVKPYAYIAAKKALEEALERRNIPGEVKYLSGLRGYQILYDIVRPGKVSIIIPTKDHVKLLGNTVDSIISKTSYTDYEIIVLNNNSTTPEFFQLMDEYSKKYSNFKCIDANIPFNFSKLMNIGVSQSKGEYILLLNNDVEVIHDDWLTKMVSFSQQDRIGVVGVKLLYPDDNIQHAGVIIGLGGVAGHAFVNNYKDDAGYFNYIQSTNNYSAVTAACIMLRRSIYDEVGGMDEKFEVEYNDVDFCLKIMDHGYNNVYLPDVELYHYESATRGHPHQSKESFERHVREVNLFKEKWDKYIKNDPYYNPNLNLGVHDFSMDFSK